MKLTPNSDLCAPHIVHALTHHKERERERKRYRERVRERERIANKCDGFDSQHAGTQTDDGLRAPIEFALCLLRGHHKRSIFRLNPFLGLEKNEKQYVRYQRTVIEQQVAATASEIYFLDAALLVASAFSIHHSDRK